MDIREEIRNGIANILGEDLISCGSTHENPPPHQDCSEDCKVSIIDQIAAVNPICSPVRSHGVKHKKCMDCWNEYISDLVRRIQEYENSKGMVLKVDVELPDWLMEGQVACNKPTYSEMLKRAGYTLTKPLIEEV